MISGLAGNVERVVRYIPVPLPPAITSDSGVNIPPAKAGTDFKHCDQDVESGTIFTIGLLYKPLGVRTVTTRIFPSCPGCTFAIRARGHFVGIVGSSRRQTMSPIAHFELVSAILKIDLM